MARDLLGMSPHVTSPSCPGLPATCHRREPVSSQREVLARNELRTGGCGLLCCRSVHTISWHVLVGEQDHQCLALVAEMTVDTPHVGPECLALHTRMPHHSMCVQSRGSVQVVRSIAGTAGIVLSSPSGSSRKSEYLGIVGYPS